VEDHLGLEPRTDYQSGDGVLILRGYVAARDSVAVQRSRDDNEWIICVKTNLHD
jgi:hypothetical protein